MPQAPGHDRRELAMRIAVWAALIAGSAAGWWAIVVVAGAVAAAITPYVEGDLVGLLTRHLGVAVALLGATMAIRTVVQAARGSAPIRQRSVRR